MVYFRVRNVRLDGKTGVTHKASGDPMVTHLVHSLLRTQGYACETALMRRAGGWNGSLRCWEDLELGVRIMSEARRRVYIPDVNVEVISREDSVTGKDFASKKGEWEKALDEMEKSLERGINRHRDKWLRYVDYRRVILAASYRHEGLKEEAAKLLRQALDSPRLNAVQRLYLRLAYAYTAAGGRGASIPAKFLF